MRVWQANLGRGVGAAEFENNLDRFLNALGDNGFGFLQEIDEADKPQEMAILRFKVKRTHRIVGERTAVPILVPKGIPLLGWGAELGCEGLARYTPHRPIVKARVRLSKNLTATLLNGHKPRRPRVPAQATAAVLRAIDHRRAKFQTVLTREARAAKADGDAVVYALDNNGLILPMVVPGEVDVIRAGIDKARAVAPKGRTEVTERRDVEFVNLTIDGHDAHGARVWFPKADR